MCDLNKLQKYQLSKTLLGINEISNKMLFEKENQKIPASFKLKYNNGYIKKESYITAYALIDLSYNLIITSNDYKSKIIDWNNPKEYTKLLWNYQYNYLNTPLDNLLKLSSSDDKNLYIMYGASQTQFLFQEYFYNSPYIFNRNFELLKIIKKESEINVDSIFKELFDMSIEEFYENMFILLNYILFKTSNSNCIEKNKQIQTIISYYQTTYKECRTSPLKQNLLLVKPFISDSKGNIIPINNLAILKVFCESPYWILRNYYMDKKSDFFINKFGLYYEEYMRKLLDYYLKDKYTYYKPDDKKNRKICDWVIETDNYLILIEQKSTISPINIKNIVFDINDLKKYIYKFKEAFEQLDDMEKLLVEENKVNKKKFLKLIMHYDYFNIQPYFKQVLVCGNLNTTSYNTCFISTEEMEQLIYILNKNPKDFNTIIEKILEVNKNNFGAKINCIINNVVNYNTFEYADEIIDSLHLFNKKS